MFYNKRVDNVKGINYGVHTSFEGVPKWKLDNMMSTTNDEPKWMPIPQDPLATYNWAPQERTYKGPVWHFLNKKDPVSRLKYKKPFFNPPTSTTTVYPEEDLAMGKSDYVPQFNTKDFSEYVPEGVITVVNDFNAGVRPKGPLHNYVKTVNQRKGYQALSDQKADPGHGQFKYVMPQTPFQNEVMKNNKEYSWIWKTDSVDSINPKAQSNKPEYDPFLPIENTDYYMPVSSVDGIKPKGVSKGKPVYDPFWSKKVEQVMLPVKGNSYGNKLKNYNNKLFEKDIIQQGTYNEQFLNKYDDMLEPIVHGNKRIRSLETDKPVLSKGVNPKKDVMEYDLGSTASEHVFTPKFKDTGDMIINHLNQLNQGNIYVPY